MKNIKESKLTSALDKKNPRLSTGGFSISDLVKTCCESFHEPCMHKEINRLLNTPLKLVKKKQQLYGPFLWMRFNCLKA